MTTGIIFFVILSLAGIIFLQQGPKNVEYSREDFLADLAKLLESKVQMRDDDASKSYIEFSFRGDDFEFEDIVSSGFSMDIMKAYLKLKSPLKYSVGFEEYSKSYTVKSKIITMSNLQQAQQGAQEVVEKPRFLDGVDVVTNNIRLTNKLLTDKKFQKTLQFYSSYNDRGTFAAGFKIISGVLILEFSSIPTFSPNLDELKLDINIIEKHISNLKYIAKTILQIQQTFEDKDARQ